MAYSGFDFQGLMSVVLKDRTILECNTSAERMLHGSRQDIINNRPEQLSPFYQPDKQRSIDAITHHFNIALEQGHHQFEWVQQRLDGDNFWVEVVVRTGQFNHQTVFFVSWREINDRKQLEQQKEQALISLNQKKLKQERLFAIIGHELRTPAAAIDMMLNNQEFDKNQLKQI